MARDYNGAISVFADNPSGAPTPIACDADGRVKVDVESIDVTVAADPTSVTSGAAFTTDVGFTSKLGWNANKAESVLLYLKNTHGSASLDYQLVGALNSALAGSGIVCGPFALAAGAETRIFRRSMPHLYYDLQTRSTASGSAASGIASGWALPTAPNSRALSETPYTMASAAAASTAVQVPVGAGAVTWFLPTLNSGNHYFWWSSDGGTTKVLFSVNDMIDLATINPLTGTGSCRVKLQVPHVGGQNCCVGCYSSVAQTASLTCVFEA